ncbi:sarcosine oxidase [Microthyrium microscopicum]|uniref:Sarcosine oxidase n=1 Tax=Microthyrium microscopicum TaxID=703497 RepID=A0A6A6U9D8_9PEZI|nr:sarcosine oxidase [Microthyrium microscopicum]
MATDKSSYIIVGAGVFGTSTALHLIRKYPRATISLIDRRPFPSDSAASWDWNKIIRSDYVDLIYAKLGQEALNLWRNDPIFKPFFQEKGVIWVDTSTAGRQMVENYKHFGVDIDYDLLSVEETKKLHGGIFSEADYTGVKEVLLNKNSGWSYAKEALESAAQAATNAGVQYICSAATSLKIDDNGTCKGVRLIDGRSISASQTILCAGAHTARILAETAPERDDLQAGHRLTAAAMPSSLADLNEEDANLFGSAPGYCHENDPKGGCIPLPSERKMKYWNMNVFTNMVTHSSGRRFSTPPDGQDNKQWDVPAGRQKEMLHLHESIFGDKGKNFKMSKYRLCWDALTPDEDFIISRHPRCEGLSIGTGGSFHGYKFFPVLGKYIVQMLDGMLAPELNKKWAWDRDFSKPTSLWLDSRELNSM